MITGGASGLDVVDDLLSIGGETDTTGNLRFFLFLTI